MQSNINVRYKVYMTNKALVKESDITRILKGIIKTGTNVSSVKVETDGTITVLCGDTDLNIYASNPWDDVDHG